MYQYQTKKRMTCNQRRRKMFEQRLMGIAMLVIAVFFIWMTATANEDSTGGLLVGAMSLPLLFSRNLWII